MQAGPGFDLAAYFLRTTRLGFRLWRLDDLPLALGLWGNPEVTRLFDARGRLSDDEVRERLEREMALQAAHGVQYWPIFRLADGAPAGCCGLRPYRPTDGWWEFGVHLRPEFWGQGFASEAGAAVIEFAFRQLRVGGLFAGHHPANERSRQLLQRLGFRYTCDEFYAPTGLQHPSYRLTVHDDPVRP